MSTKIFNVLVIFIKSKDIKISMNSNFKCSYFKWSKYTYNIDSGMAFLFYTWIPIFSSIEWMIELGFIALSQTFMMISGWDRKPGPGHKALPFSIDPKVSFSCHGHRESQTTCYFSIATVSSTINYCEPILS